MNEKLKNMVDTAAAAIYKAAVTYGFTSKVTQAKVEEIAQKVYDAGYAQGCADSLKVIDEEQVPAEESAVAPEADPIEESNIVEIDPVEETADIDKAPLMDQEDFAESDPESETLYAVKI